MGSIFRIVVFLFTLAAAIFPPAVLYAQEARTGAVDAYLLIDTSDALGDTKEEALAWTSSAVLRGLLREGDRLTIWTVGSEPRVLYQGEIAGQDGFAQVETLILNLGTETGAADYAAALKEAVLAEARREDRTPIAFALLLSGYSEAGGGRDILKDEGLAQLLRFSRVEDHAGWKAIVVGLGMGEKARSAAAAYMERRENGATTVP